MKKLPLLFIAILCLVACSNKHSQDSKKQSSIDWKHYSCEWFDFDYPSYFQTDEVRNEISDTIPGLKAGGEVTLYGDALPYRIRLVKSSLFDVFATPEQWRDLSMELKHYDNPNDKMTYLGVYDTKDSLYFQGHPAASVHYAALENGDTLVHYQLVVLKQPAKDLYYLNYMAPVAQFYKYWETADSVFNTIKLK